MKECLESLQLIDVIGETMGCSVSEEDGEVTIGLSSRCELVNYRLSMSYESWQQMKEFIDEAHEDIRTDNHRSDLID